MSLRRPNQRRDSPEIEIQNGRDKANLIRETSPSGAIVLHAVKKSGYVHERLHELGRIDNDMYDAAERFCSDFTKASLAGRYSTLDMNRSGGGGKHVISDTVVEARQRIHESLASLGNQSLEKSLTKSCVWFVVGCGDTLEQWAFRMRTSGANMSEGKASGILISALERLALHYGLTSESRIKHDAGRKSFLAGIEFSIKFAESLPFSENKTAQEAIKSFSSLLRKRFSMKPTTGATL